jgi:hypothetical protein
MKIHTFNAIKGALMGAAISAAVFAPMLISIERATPSGFNVFFGDYGFHFAMGAAQ